MTEDGLREKKKHLTKKHLAESAFNLAMEKGLDGFVIEDIVNKAGYSRRTFANYFSCKEEAVADVLPIKDKNSLYDSSFFSIEDYTPLTAIELFIKHSFTINKLNRLHDLISLSQDHPTLKLYVIGSMNELQKYARESISKAYADAYSEEYYHLLIGAVFGALMPLLEGSMEVQLPKEQVQSDDNNNFVKYIESIFSNLRLGFK